MKDGSEVTVLTAKLDSQSFFPVAYRIEEKNWAGKCIYSLISEM